MIRHGSILRAARVQGQPPVKTRRVWLRGTRVLQVKYGTSTYQNVLGLEGLGRTWHNPEMNMLLHSINDGLDDANVQLSDTQESDVLALDPHRDVGRSVHDVLDPSHDVQTGAPPPLVPAVRRNGAVVASNPPGVSNESLLQEIAAMEPTFNVSGFLPSTAFSTSPALANSLPGAVSTPRPTLLLG